MSAESVDKLMYSFVIEDVLKGVFIHVPPGYVACVYDLGRGVLKKVLTPGLHLKIPFWQKAKLFNTQTLEYSISREFNPKNENAMGDIPIQVETKDDKKLVIEGTVLLRLDIHQIPAIWQTIGEDFIHKIIRPTIQSRMRLIMSHWKGQEVISTKRDEVEEDIRSQLEKLFKRRGIFVEDVLLSEVSPVGRG